MNTPASEVSNRDPGDEAPTTKWIVRDVLIESLLAENNKLRGIIRRAIPAPVDSDAVAAILLTD